MSRRPPRVVTRLRGFPRVSGDEPPTGLIDLIESAFSPRERG